MEDSRDIAALVEAALAAAETADDAGRVAALEELHQRLESELARSEPDAEAAG